ncbi:MAG: hypothetical protein WCZ28_13670 [Burkholderiaceae bacterium]
MSALIDAALATHSPGPGTGPSAGRVALVAGAVGRQGEALLAAVLARGGYSRVHVLSDAPMALGIDRLELCALGELPRIDDILMLVSQGEDSAERSFHGRDAPFVQVTGGDAGRVAAAACATGARRLLVIRPSPAWQQLGDLQRSLGGADELELAQLPFQSVLILRPVRIGGGPGGDWLRRVVNTYMSLQFLMTPKSIPTLTSDQVARAALRALGLPGHGIRVMLARQLAELLESAGATGASR